MDMIQAEKSTSNGVMLVTLNHAPNNTLHPDLVFQLQELLNQAEKQSEVRALVFTGSGPKCFCTGLDLEFMMQTLSLPQKVIRYVQDVNRLFRRLTLFPKPTVAAINGHAFGGGLFLAAHLDFRLMREDRGFVCLPEVDVHLPLLPGMIAIMREVIAAPSLHKLFYTGVRLSGPEAMKIGLLDDLSSAEDLVNKSVALAADLAKKHTETYAEIKRHYKAAVIKCLDTEDDEAIAQIVAGWKPE